MTMVLKNTFLVALRAIYINKGRSILTMLGVIIGVASVVLLTALGNGLQAYITDQFESLGSNNIIVAPGQVFSRAKSSDGSSSGGGFGNRDTQASSLANNPLKLSYANDLKKLREYVSYVSYANTKQDEAKFQNNQKTVSVFGTNEDYDKIFSTPMLKGKFFTKADDQGAERVAVLGSKITEELFGGADPIGKKIKIGNQLFTVIGSAESKGGGFGGPSFDEYIYIPYRTMSQIYDTQAVLSIYAKAKSKETIPATITAIDKALQKHMKETEFSVFDQSEILSTINGILGMLTVGLGGIAAISLLVGGIGIMNIMLVSVTERTREIGLRLAIGAMEGEVLLQFLIEVVVLSALGGIIGIVLATGASIGLASLMDVPYVFNLGVNVLSFVFSAAIGVVFGYFPARRAARLDPIEALRHE